MNMELLINHLRKNIPKRVSCNFKNLQQLKNIVTEISKKISERAFFFIEKLFTIDSLREINLEDFTYAIPNPSQSPVCSRIMTQHLGIASFRCYDCMQSSSSCICQFCFKQGDHQGHNYMQYGAVNGCCDCGNAQAWNEKGFCKQHSANYNFSVEIPQSTKSQFITEGTLLIYIYLYLCLKWQNQESLSLTQEYGSLIFNFFARQAHKNYDMKLLSSQLLQSKIPQQYQSLSMQNLTIIQYFFTVPDKRAKSYQSLIHFFFEIFPVEDHRRSILKLYFKRYINSQSRLTSQSPLAGLNFQYLSCVKLIINMIKTKQLQPLQFSSLNNLPLTNRFNAISIPRFFKKYYQDLDYIHNMKSAKQYEKLHLSLTNVASLAEYRQFSQKSAQNNLIPHIEQYNIDEMFVKIFSKFVANIVQQKQLIQKSLSQLFNYLIIANQNLASLAQQRAFSMLVMAYFDGDLTKLSNKSIRDSFIKILRVNNEQFKYGLQHLIETSLRTKINLSSLPVSEKGVYERYFIRINSERNVVNFLDSIFHKILIYLSEETLNYGQIVLKLYNVLQKTHNLQLQQKQNEDNPKEQIDEISNLFNKIAVVLQLLNFIQRSNMDEIVINGMIKIIDKQKVFALFSRVLASFKTLNPKQFQNLCQQIVRNQQLFEEFVKTKTVNEKGKLKLKQPVKPLEHFVYSSVFKHFSKQINQNQIVFLNGEEQINNQFVDIEIINIDLVDLLVDKCMELIMKLVQQQNKESLNAFNQIVIELFKIYLSDQTKFKLSSFFQCLLNQSLRSLISKEVIEQITLTEKKMEELNQNLEKLKLEQAEQFKLKREKIMNKRKMKDQLIKKSQAQMLSKFTKQVQQFKSINHEKNCCIYCKNQTNQHLNLISYVSLTNLIEQSILKKPYFHYFFSSCGHYIHYSCFAEANQKNHKRYCFLCKQQSNILIPDMISMALDNPKEVANRFRQNILSAIIQEYELVDDKIGHYQNFLFKQNIELLIVSFAKELVYNGLHGIDYFKKSLYIVYVQIFQILKVIDKQMLRQAFGQLKLPEKHVSNQKIQLLVKFIEIRLEQILLEPVGEELDYSFLPLSSEQIVQANKIIEIIKNKSPQINYFQIKQINPDVLITKIPETLKQLHLYMGKCKICPNVTNNIFLCLLCGWSSCIKCKELIFKHIKEQHLDGAVLIGCSTGSIKYVKGDSIFQDSSIYQNYMGINFTDADSYAEMSRSQKYFLSKQKQIEVKNIILHYNVHQKIKSNSYQ